MSHDKEKRYFEHLAKLILEELYPERYKDLIEQDSPDLKTQDGCGIEVTRSFYTGDAEASGLFQYLTNQGENIERAKERIEKLGYKLIERNGRIIGITTKEAIWETTKEIEVAFLKKYKKIKNYTDKVDLFIYAPMFDCYSVRMITEFVKWIDSQIGENELSFGCIYIFDYASIYVCEMERKTVIRQELQDNMVRKWVVQAREYAEK